MVMTYVTSFTVEILACCRTLYTARRSESTVDRRVGSTVQRGEYAALYSRRTQPHVVLRLRVVTREMTGGYSGDAIH